MFRYFVIAVCAFTISSAGIPKPILKVVVPEQQAQATHNLEISAHGGSGYGGDYGGGHGGSDDGKYASGSELTSLAHSSAVQANNAVQSQHTAGSQAAFGAKSSLATAAIGAAMTAQAALVGKQVIVQGLKKQLGEAQHQLQSEIGQFHTTQSAASAAEEAAQQAQVTLNALSGALAAAQGSAQHSSKAATEAAAASAAQHSMVIEAKQRVSHITEQLHSALAELQETEAAAQKAIGAAHIAQSNAAAAGAAVVTASQSSHGGDGGHDGGSGGYHY